MIPAEAVEAAARAHHGHGNPPGRKSWDELAPMVRRIRIKKARLALEAAAPHMLAGAWSEGYRDGLTNMEYYGTPIPNPYRTTK